MSDTSTIADVKPRLDFSRVLAVILHPRQAFGAEAGSGWRTPMLILSISSILTIIVTGFLKARAAVSAAVELPPDFQYWTPEMQDNFFQSQQTTQSPVLVYVMPLVGALIALWLGWLIFGGMLHLTSTLLGGRGVMGGTLNLVAWASLPFALRDVLRIIFMLLAGHTINSPGLSGFVSGGGFWAQILMRVDIFYIWYAFLLILGISGTESLSKPKSITAVLIVIAISLLAQAGVGAMMAGLGEMAAQPFF
ncbi:MAG: YIP1 family protein [Chloroflexi bacterium]|nr:YIP1 family protein [Chloroflexota bacterium]